MLGALGPHSVAGTSGYEVMFQRIKTARRVKFQVWTGNNQYLFSAQWRSGFHVRYCQMKGVVSHILGYNGLFYEIVKP